MSSQNSVPEDEKAGVVAAAEGDDDDDAVRIAPGVPPETAPRTYGTGPIQIFPKTAFEPVIIFSKNELDILIWVDSEETSKKLKLRGITRW